MQGLLNVSWTNFFALALMLTSLSLLPSAAKRLYQGSKHKSSLVAQNISDASSEQIGVSPGEIKIGSCAPLTGPLQERGNQLVIGANSYFNYINEKGGVNGRKIKLTVCDDKYDPDKAIECFNNCLKNKVFAGSFFVGSPPISKYVRMGELTKTPLMGFCTGTPAAYDFRRNQFVVRPSYIDEVNALVDLLSNSKRMSKLAIIYQNDAFGAAISENVIKRMAKYGAAPIAEVSFSRNAQNLDQEFAKIKASNPDAVVVAATSESLNSIVKLRYTQNCKSLFLSVSITDDYLLKMPKEAAGIVVSQVVPEIDDKSPSAALYNKLRHKYFPDSQPNMTSFEAFINALVMVEGLNKAGPELTRDKFIKAMETIHDFDIGCGPRYRLNFTDSNHNGLTSAAIYFATVRDAKLTTLSKENLNQLLNK